MNNANAAKITTYLVFLFLTLLIALILATIAGVNSLDIANFTVKLDDPTVTAPFYFCVSVGSIVCIPMLRKSGECGYWGDIQVTSQKCARTTSAIIGYVLLCVGQLIFLTTYFLFVNNIINWSIDLLTILWGISIFGGALAGFIFLRRR